MGTSTCGSGAVGETGYIYVSPRTVRAYWPPEPERRGHRRTSSQNWRTFVRNHAQSIVACDFLVVVTARFRTLYVFLLMEVGTRRIVRTKFISTTGSNPTIMAASRRTTIYIVLYIKVERMVCLSDPSDFELRRTFCVAHPVATLRLATCLRSLPICSTRKACASKSGPHTPHYARSGGHPLREQNGLFLPP